MKARPLPPPLRGRPLRTAEVLAAGIPESRLRRRDLTSITRGVWAPVELATDEDRLRAARLALPPDAAFSHLTAGVVHGMPLPPRHPNAPREPIHAMRPTGASQIRRAGWVGHRGLETRRVVVVRGLPVTDLVDTWLDLGPSAVGTGAAWSRDDLVVAGDHVLNRLIAWTDAEIENLPPWEFGVGLANPHRDAARVQRALAEILERLERRVDARAGAVLCDAAAAVRAGVRSPQETRARLLFVHHGFPEPEVNGVILAPDGSGRVAEGDLVWREAKVVVEYQSAFHADRRRRSADAARILAVQEEGWTVHEMWAEDLYHSTRRLGLLRRVGASLGWPGGIRLED